MTPQIGDIVLYSLTSADHNEIHRRQLGEPINPERNIHKKTEDRANPRSWGQLVPLIVVVVWPNEWGEKFDGVNGQAIIDGNFSLWITSAKEGTEPGQWRPRP